MTLNEFNELSERVIIRKHVQFHFTKVRENHWLLEVPIATHSKKIGDVPVYDYISAQTTMTTIEAYKAYKNIQAGGLEKRPPTE